MPEPGTPCDVLTESTCGLFRISFLNERILLLRSLSELAFTVSTWSLLNPRSLLRKYFNCPYTTQVQMSMIIEIENCTTTNARRKVTLLEPFERLPFKTCT